MTSNSSKLHSSLKVIIGVNCGHNPSVVLNYGFTSSLRLEEEKVTGYKGIKGFPAKSFEILMTQVHSNSEVNLAFSFQNVSECFVSHFNLARNFYFSLSDLPYFALDLLRVLFPQNFHRQKYFQKHLCKKLKQTYPDRNFNFSFVNHHLAHALSAAVDSGWNDLFLITEDGKGDGLSGSIYLWQKNEFKKLRTINEQDSLGNLYAAATKALGFKPLRHEGKITGLAAYGHRTEVTSLIKSFFLLYPDGRRQNNILPKEISRLKLLGIALSGLQFTSAFKNLRYLLRLDFKHLYFTVQFNEMEKFFKSLLNKYSREQIAFGVQSFVEEAVVLIVNSLSITGVRNIGLAGGLFANVKCNQRIREHPSVNDIFVQPAMDDSGAALGAAYVRELELSAKVEFKVPTLNSVVFLGESDSTNDFEVSEYGGDSEVARQIGRSLIEGLIVGVFWGRMEWGPRALGNRSILALPSKNGVSSELNRRLKRSDFMPFAPMIISDDAERYLIGYSKGSIAAKFMTCTYSVTDEMQRQFPDVVHVDKTVRPQVIGPEDHPLIYKILEVIRSETGSGVLLNTSFNIHESPIVNDLRAAVECLRSGAIDILYTRTGKISVPT